MSSGGRQALQIWHIADPSKFKAGPTRGVGILGKWHSLSKLDIKYILASPYIFSSQTPKIFKVHEKIRSLLICHNRKEKAVGLN